MASVSSKTKAPSMERMKHAEAKRATTKVASQNGKPVL
jgi:hypothetical protein